MAVLHRVLDVLRIMVDPTDDDQVLYSARDVEFAVGVEEAEIAGTQPGFGVLAVDPRLEDRISRLRVAPIPLSHMRPGRPHFADQARSEPPPALRVDDGETLPNELATATDETVSVLAERRGNHLIALQGIAAEALRHRCGAPLTCRDQQSRFGHAVGGVEALGVEAIGRESRDKSLDSVSPDGLGSVIGELPAGEIDPLHLLVAMASDTKIKREVGTTGHLCPVIVDRPQPA